MCGYVWRCGKNGIILNIVKLQHKTQWITHSVASTIYRNILTQIDITTRNLQSSYAGRTQTSQKPPQPQILSEAAPCYHTAASH